MVTPTPVADRPPLAIQTEEPERLQPLTAILNAYYRRITALYRDLPAYAPEAEVSTRLHEHRNWLAERLRGFFEESLLGAAQSAVDDTTKLMAKQGVALEHLPGKHDQKTHGRGGGGVPQSVIDFEERVRDEPVEHMSIFDREGNRIGSEAVGDKEQVRWSDDTMKILAGDEQWQSSFMVPQEARRANWKRNLINSHNHPLDMGPSDGDVLVAHRFGVKTIRAASAERTYELVLADNMVYVSRRGLMEILYDAYTAATALNASSTGDYVERERAVVDATWNRLKKDGAVESYTVTPRKGRVATKEEAKPSPSEGDGDYIYTDKWMTPGERKKEDEEWLRRQKQRHPETQEFAAALFELLQEHRGDAGHQQKSHGRRRQGRTIPPQMAAYEESIRNAPVEHAAVFDSLGRMWGGEEGIGDEVSVELTSQTLGAIHNGRSQARGLTLTHNHPSWGPHGEFQETKGGHSAISQGDVLFSHSLGLGGVRAVNRNFTYEITFTDKSYPLHEGDFYDLVERHLESAVPKRGGARSAPQAMRAIDRTWKKLAEKGYITYTVTGVKKGEPRPYWPPLKPMVEVGEAKPVKVPAFTYPENWENDPEEIERIRRWTEKYFPGRPEETQEALEQEDLTPVNINLRSVPQRVASYAMSRGRGEVGASLSDNIWNIVNVGNDTILAAVNYALQQGMSPQQFGRFMEPYLLPGREFPKGVPSSRFSNQPRSLAYNAFRLARTEIVQAYNSARQQLDSTLSDLGMVVGSRWMLSRQHKLRLRRLGLTRDICDDHAMHEEPSLQWLRDYGVDTKGLWPPGSAPDEHPNGLCVVVPVPTPDELMRMALGTGSPQATPEPLSLLPPKYLSSWLRESLSQLGSLGGASQTFTAKAANGRSVLVKPESGLPGSWSRPNINPASELGNERAAYLLSGHFRVQTPLMESIVGETALHWLVAEQAEGTVGMDAAINDPEEVRKAALFDAVIGNCNRHVGCYLVDAKGQIILTDHTLAFPEAQHVDYGGNFDFVKAVGKSTINKEERELLERFVADREEIVKALGSTLTPAAIDAMFRRAGDLLGGKTFEEVLLAV